MNMIPNLDFMKTIVNGLANMIKTKIDFIQNKVDNLDADISGKQDKLIGTIGQVVGFDTEKKITLDESVFVRYTDDEITNFYNTVTV